MTLKHPKGPQPPAEDMSVAPLFTPYLQRTPILWRASVHDRG